MSVVTGIVICHTLVEEYTEDVHGKDHYAIIDSLNAFLAGYGKLPLVELDESMSCGKHPRMKVWGGGYNYFPDVDFVRIFRHASWEEPDQVFMILNPENGPIRVFVPRKSIHRGIPD